MLCPICKTKLIVTGQARLETVSEHVTLVRPSVKDKYGCLNPACIACEDDLIWDEWGAYYCGAIEKETWKKKYPFIDGNDGPFGSSQRRINVVVYKKDENWTLLNLYWLKFRVKYLYKANEDGEILSRKSKVEIWKRGGMCWVLYISGVHMLRYSLEQGIRAYKKRVDWPKKFEECLQYRSWDKRWWHRLSVWLLRLRYRKG